MTDEELKSKIHSVRKDIRLLSGHLRCLENELTFIRQTFDETYAELYPLELELARREERYHIIPLHKRKPQKPLAIQIAEQMREQPEEIRRSFFAVLCEQAGIDPTSFVSSLPKVEDTDV